MSAAQALVRVRQAGHEITAARAELATGAAILGGWALVTHGVASLLPHGHVWPLSGGLLLLSLAGWRLLFTVARDGLYTLSREESRRG